MAVTGVVEFGALVCVLTGVRCGLAGSPSVWCSELADSPPAVGAWSGLADSPPVMGASSGGGVTDGGRAAFFSVLCLFAGVGGVSWLMPWSVALNSSSSLSDGGYAVG